MQPVEPFLTEKSIVTEFSSVNADVLSPMLSDHRYSLSLPLHNKCTSCEYKSLLITSYVRKQTVKPKQKFFGD